MKVHLRLEDNEETIPASTPPFARERAELVLADALEALTPKGALPKRVEISLSFIPEGLMRERNREHMGVDEATDVLSFPLWEEDGEFRPSRMLPTLPLGDILICPDVARKNAASEEALPDEMALLLAHGFLHLLAWDHDTEDRRIAMEQTTERIKTELLKALVFSGPVRAG
ncbi:MAG: rRNA maturation RNase YbeY [Synergistaceae bacterium]|nr:rRNA maturation RNase YbeY [Synergistaceae bacterium]